MTDVMIISDVCGKGREVGGNVQSVGRLRSLNLRHLQTKSWINLHCSESWCSHEEDQKVLV